MSCTDIEKQLNDYVDGDLSAQARRSIDEHLGSCLSCHRALGELNSLLERAQRLPTEIEPRRELWPGIESRIGAAPTESSVAPPKTPFRHWSSLAVAAILLLAVAVPFVLQLEQGAGEPQSDSRLTDGGPAREQSALFAAAMLARSEDGVLRPRRDLLEALEKQRGLLSPTTITTIEENARLIDQAIGQLREALNENPGDRQLELLLAARYKQEVDLLLRVSRV